MWSLENIAYLTVEPKKAALLQILAVKQDSSACRLIETAGEVDKKFTKIALCFGTPGGVRELLMNEAEIVITGEASEWKISEYARDAALLGMDKAVIVMGHIGSEAGGMIVFADELAKKYPQLEVKYFESGAVYKEI